jgi:class 3 adenylate cyclase
MTFEEIVDQAIALLQRRGRVTCRTLKRQFHLDDDALEDLAVRACYAALAIQEAIRHYNEAVRRTHGITVQIRIGLNSGEVIVRAIGNDLHMDYSAIGQTTHANRASGFVT